MAPERPADPRTDLGGRPDDAGEIQVASGPKPALAPELAAKAPLLRGLLRLAEAFVLIPMVRLLRSARLPFEDVRVIAAMPILPEPSRAVPAWEQRGRSSSRPPGPGAGDGRAQRPRNLAAYHGVEHKAIGAYEQGPTIRPRRRRSTSAAAPTWSRRC